MKIWYQSKTLWTNVAVLGVIGFSAHYGLGLSDEQVVRIVALVLPIVNLILRAVTRKGIVVRSGNGFLNKKRR